MATCDRCHRQRAETLAEYIASADPLAHPPTLCGRGLPIDDGEPRRSANCRAARNRWLEDEIERLTARVAELEAHAAPQWDGNCLLHGCAAVDVAYVCQSADGTWRCGGQPVVGERGFQLFGFATEADAKAAAEKACGVEVVK